MIFSNPRKFARAYARGVISVIYIGGKPTIHVESKHHAARALRAKARIAKRKAARRAS